MTGKEDMREIKTAQRGDMKVFNFELTDDQGGCIRIAAFNDVAEKFYAVVQKGSVCSFSIFNLASLTVFEDYFVFIF